MKLQIFNTAGWRHLPAPGGGLCSGDCQLEMTGDPCASTPALQFLLEGSANINQRSQDGRRDTEIAQGCTQPHFRPQGRGMVWHLNSE